MEQIVAITQSDLRLLLQGKTGAVSDGEALLNKTQALYEDSLVFPCGVFDVDYITPSNNKGTLYALDANNLVDAVLRAQVRLAYGTTYSPSEFVVYSARLTDIRES